MKTFSWFGQRVLVVTSKDIELLNQRVKTEEQNEIIWGVREARLNDYQVWVVSWVAPISPHGFLPDVSHIPKILRQNANILLIGNGKNVELIEKLSENAEVFTGIEKAEPADSRLVS